MKIPCTSNDFFNHISPLIHIASFLPECPLFAFSFSLPCNTKAMYM